MVRTEQPTNWVLAAVILLCVVRTTIRGQPETVAVEQGVVPISLVGMCCHTYLSYNERGNFCLLSLVGLWRHTYLLYTEMEGFCSLSLVGMWHHTFLLYNERGDFCSISWVGLWHHTYLSYTQSRLMMCKEVTDSRSQSVQARAARHTGLTFYLICNVRPHFLCLLEYFLPAKSDLSMGLASLHITKFVNLRWLDINVDVK